MKTLRFLKILNIISSVIIAGLAVYIVVYPYLPDASATSIDINLLDADNTPLDNSNPTVPPTVTPYQIPDENRLIIPKISVDSPIGENSDKNALTLGMMHLPNTSTPDKGGNTVIIGHRVLYTSGPNTLYNLDKVTLKDIIIVWWQQKEYDYKVFETKVVQPDDVEIENNTKQAIITIYTCTPRWTSQKRLVVRAILEQ